MRFFVAILLVSFFLLFLSTFAISQNDCSGTNSNPCHCCDVDSMTVTVTSPSGSYSQQYSLSYDSQSGTCGSTPEVTETWKRNIGYTFCPEEGIYTATVVAHAAGGDQSCGSYSNEQSNSFDLYTVNYDSGTDADKWCACKGKIWFSTVTDGNNGNCCGDDGDSDMFESSGEGNPACVKGNKVDTNKASSDKRYMVYNGEIYFCKGPGDTSSGYSFIPMINPGSIIGKCKCTMSGTWDCGATVVSIRGGRFRILV